MQHIEQYGRSSPDVWSFIFSFPTSINAYAAIGFSNDGKMVKSSALVGWISGFGSGGMNEYYLGGLSESDVVPGRGDLDYMNATIIQPDPSLVYMIFQLKTNQPSSKLIYSIGPNGVFPDKNGKLQQHSDAISTVIDYSQGVTSEVSSLKLRRSHGIMNMASWSILMIIGSIIARHFKQWNPIWFYLHASIQTISFVAGTVGTLVGFALSKKVDVNVHHHKNIAIIILVLGILQVFAIILRPKPESKLRKYWNWYHHYVGRILIIFAVVNTFYGLSLAKEGSKWFLAYGVSIAILFIITIILEVRRWIIARRETQSTKNSSHPQSMEFAYHT
ncbi:hypothetical protein PIB30_023634 [Stylosanthes scabra]|uniref:Cytochrome b561 and DOMON domain-containing protein n=1 Tax=Stylosanthes scabra TaxID=79078 RepID=A0ABU6Q943_9FABA|nr:hypothetical protein [Stylosanthes scabra]